MKRHKGTPVRIAALAALSMALVVSYAPCAHAAHVFGQEEPVVLTVVNTALAFLIFSFGIYVIRLTSGGFLSLSFIFITSGIMIGWVLKLIFDFLLDSGIVATDIDVSAVAEAAGGFLLVVGFGLLSQKLKS